MSADLQALLEELAAYPSTEHPFLSIYLDWRPDGTGLRQSVVQLEQELERIAGQVKQRGGDLESYEADRQRIINYVNVEAPKEAQGLAIFACNAEGVWFAQPLQVPIETSVAEDRYPHTFNLARILDDYETYAVVLADSQESRIFVLTLNDAEAVGSTDAGEQVKRFQAGGWGQMLFQRRTDNVIKAHHKEISDKLERLIKRYDVQHVIIAGNDSIKGSIRESLSTHVQDKLVDLINLDIQSNVDTIMQTIEPMIREVERQQEADDVDTLEAQVNTKGGLGVVGVRDTAMALSKGQVRLLIMAADFHAVGSMNPTSGFLYEGIQRKDPFDGSELEQVNLREAFTAKATQQGATMQIVESNEYLSRHDGVGALLWYNDTTEQPHQQERAA